MKRKELTKIHDFKLQKNFNGLHGLYKNIFSVVRVNKTNGFLITLSHTYMQV